MAGSAYYIAPEVLSNSYGMEADMWSVGIILYIMLCGVPPFWAEEEEEIFAAIRGEQPVDVGSGAWGEVSGDAKDLVQRMLTRDPAKRITPAKALGERGGRGGGRGSVFWSTSMLMKDLAKRVKWW